MFPYDTYDYLGGCLAKCHKKVSICMAILVGIWQNVTKIFPYVWLFKLVFGKILDASKLTNRVAADVRKIKKATNDIRKQENFKNLLKNLNFIPILLPHVHCLQLICLSVKVSVNKNGIWYPPVGLYIVPHF